MQEPGEREKQEKDTSTLNCSLENFYSSFFQIFMYTMVSIIHIYIHYMGIIRKYHLINFISEKELIS